MGIVKTRTTPYHPQSDGLVEILNLTLLSMLATAVLERHFEWEDHLHHLCMVYNSSIQATTKYTPFYLMFGRQAKMPIDVVYGCAPLQLLPCVSIHQGCEEVWRQHTNKYRSKSISNLIGKRRYTIRESMGIPLKKENWYSFIAKQHHEASVENCTDHGQGLT